MSASEHRYKHAGRPDGHDHDHHDPQQIHAHDHNHPDDDGNHDHVSGLWARLRHAATPHSHDAADSIDSALESSARGIRAVKISLVVLGVTAIAQLTVVYVSGSVALLADTIHNFSDALTAVPLWIAFALGRRAATRRYNYGYGRAEDLAGLFVIAMIALSGAVAGWQVVNRLLHPAPVNDLGWVALAGFVGFLGNEAVALYRIREGRAIGSAALVADGHHARTDGLTSLAVLVGAGGVAVGWNWADPVVGLAITVAIVMVLRTAARDVFRRLMEASSPSSSRPPSPLSRTSLASRACAVCGCAGSATRSTPRPSSTSTPAPASSRRMPWRIAPRRSWSARPPTYGLRWCTPTPPTRTRRSLRSRRPSRAETRPGHNE